MGLFSLAALIIIGVIIGNMFSDKNVAGTKAVFAGLANLWGTSVNGLLGKTS
jgi:hypothetical protein